MDRNELEKKMQRIEQFRMKLDHNVKAGKKGFQKKEKRATRSVMARFLPENYKLIESYCQATGMTLSEFMRSAANEYLRSHRGQSEKPQEDKATEMA